MKDMHRSPQEELKRLKIDISMITSTFKKQSIITTLKRIAIKQTLAVYRLYGVYYANKGRQGTTLCLGHQIFGV